MVVAGVGSRRRCYGTGGRKISQRGVGYVGSGGLCIVQGGGAE